MTAGTAPPVTQTQEPPLAPFAARALPGARHRRTLMRRLAARPGRTLTVQSTYEIFRNSAAAFGDRTALTFLKTRRPGRRYGELELSRTAGRHPPDGQPAAQPGAGPARRRRHPAARLPGIPPGAMGRRGGLRGAAAESAAIRGQAGGAAERHRRARADRLRRRGRLRILDQGAAPARARAQPAQPAARRAYGRARVGAALPEGALDFNAARAAMPADRLASGRRIQGTRRGRLAPYGRHHRRAKLAIHTHANQVFTAWAAVQLQTPAPAMWSSTAIRCSTWPAPCPPRWPRCRPASPPPSSPRRSCCATARCCAITGAWSSAIAPLQGRADHPGGAGRGAAGRRGHFLAALLPHWRRAAASRTGRALRAAIRPASTKAWA